MSGAKRIVVAIATGDPARAAEALRAAVGLGLRGDRIEVVALAPLPAGPSAERARRTLGQLGARVSEGREALARAVAEADAVEVWT